MKYICITSCTLKEGIGSLLSDSWFCVVFVFFFFCFFKRSGGPEQWLCAYCFLFNRKKPYSKSQDGFGWKGP